jgi:hypothetical protein
MRGDVLSGTRPYTVGAIRAFFYYEEKRAFGSEDLLSGKLALRNVPTGGGDAESASNATLITVDVAGPGFPTKGAETLRVVVHSGKMMILDQKVPLNLFFSHSGRLSVPFIAYGTGCEPLRITATLEAGRRQGSTPVIGTVPFTCGE